LNTHDSCDSNISGAIVSTHRELNDDSIQDLEDLDCTFVPLAKYKKKGKLSVTGMLDFLVYYENIKLNNTFFK
jgi:hypothetical protein